MNQLTLSVSALLCPIMCHIKGIERIKCESRIGLPVSSVVFNADSCFITHKHSYFSFHFRNMFVRLIVRFSFVHTAINGIASMPFAKK